KAGVLIGAAAGSAVMFMLDPNYGRRRRALMRDQVTRATRQTREGLTGVRGVTGVSNELEPHEPSERVPALQGGGRLAESPRRSWKPARAVLGAGLLATGVWMAMNAARAAQNSEPRHAAP